MHYQNVGLANPCKVHPGRKSVLFNWAYFYAVCSNVNITSSLRDVDKFNHVWKACVCSDAINVIFYEDSQQTERSEDIVRMLKD